MSPPEGGTRYGIGIEWITHRSDAWTEERTEMNEPSAPLSGNELLERLLELEAVKNVALLEFDADSYETAAAEQTHLVSLGTLEKSSLSRESVVALAQKTQLNFALLLNLISISPYFALIEQGYTAEGVSEDGPKQRLTVQG